VDKQTAKRLLDINHQFYQTFAQQFSSTRQRIQPGVRKILPQIPLTGEILDLGCGNGELWQALHQYGFAGGYIGLDNSQGLLEIARQRTPGGATQQAFFLQADLAAQDWKTELVRQSAAWGIEAFPATFDRILAFAVLHHIPGYSLRLQLLQNIHQLVAPQGQFIHSEWQFLNSPRLKERVQPWSLVGLEDDWLDPGDYLLDWRQGGKGLRYVHQFDEAELSELAEDSGFHLDETFYSDGENGKSGLYQVWTAVK
jgi:tRNA (uracil-5-)-methyltransferase TRM9